MLAIYSNLLLRTTLFVLGATATIVVSNADESLKYRFRGGFFTVDYGVVTEMSESDGRSFRLENDLSDAQSGAQITTRSIEGGGYLSFDWATENEASPSDYSYLRISPRNHNLPNFEHTFHSPSMAKDRGTFRRYLPEGEFYTVSIGVHDSDSNSDAYDLEIHNLNFERIEHPETGLIPEIDTYLFVAPDRDPTREGTDTTPDPITRPEDTPNIPDTNPVGGGTDSTPDPITRPGGMPTIPDTTPVGGGTGSTPDPITRPGDTPTVPDTNPVGGGTDLIPDLITLPGITPMYPDYTPRDTGTGPIFTHLPGYTASGPGTTIPGMPITTSLSTTTGPFSGTGPAPTLTAFTLPSFSPSSGTGNGPTGTLETHSVPDSSLGFIGIATLLSLLFTKALMPKSTSRN